MGVLIVIGVALLAGVLLLWIVAKLVVELGLIAALMIATASVGVLAIAAAIGVAAALAFAQVAGASSGTWPAVGGLLVGAVAAVALFQGVMREVRSGISALGLGERDTSSERDV
jgi:hypothetical protein